MRAVPLSVDVSSLHNATNTTTPVPSGSTFQEGLALYMTAGVELDAGYGSDGYWTGPTFNMTTFRPTAAGQTGWIQGSKLQLPAAYMQEPYHHKLHSWQNGIALQSSTVLAHGELSALQRMQDESLCPIAD